MALRLLSFGEALRSESIELTRISMTSGRILGLG